MGRVRNALLALPGSFSSSTHITGVAATDLFSLNTMLGAALEIQVVDALNGMRNAWDPDGQWARYHFDRQSQTFPDVLLRKEIEDGHEVALGIELKGWYVLSMEGEPSFRYSVTPGACTEWDLLAVVPWHLSDVLAGTPQVRSPGLWPAKFVAEYRNWWWKHDRRTSADTTILSPADVRPYERRAHTTDRPLADGGNNFGRIARVGLMDNWVTETLSGTLAGIPIQEWITFLKSHQD